VRLWGRYLYQQCSLNHYRQLGLWAQLGCLFGVISAAVGAWYVLLRDAENVRLNLPEQGYHLVFVVYMVAAQSLQLGGARVRLF
jgi:hypothetical protein